jgi:hypothetical protein
MTTVNDYLNSLAETMADFGKEMARLKTLEADTAKWKETVTESRMLEQAILHETGDVDNQAKRLSEQRAKTAVLEQRAVNIEDCAQTAYVIGSEALHLFSGACCYGQEALKDWASSSGVDPSTISDPFSPGILPIINQDAMSPQEFSDRRRRALATFERELPQRLSRLNSMLVRMESDKSRPVAIKKA